MHILTQKIIKQNSECFCKTFYIWLLVGFICGYLLGLDNFLLATVLFKN